MQYRITTEEIIHRQYLISAPSEAAALEYTGRYMGEAPARRLVSEDGPVTTHPERIEHIEEEPATHCPVCQVTEGVRCRHPNGYTCAQPHDERPSAWDGPGLDCCERCDHPTQEIGRHRPNGPIVPLCSECQELERVNWDRPND